MTLSKALKLTVVVILFVCSLGLERFGSYLNYRVRDYYLSQEIESAKGVVSGIKRINIVKLGHADFYEISFNANGKNYSNGLLVDYAEKDSKYFDKYRKAKTYNSTLSVENFGGNQVHIIYSKKFPSFFRIGD